MLLQGGCQRRQHRRQQYLFRGSGLPSCLSISDVRYQLKLILRNPVLTVPAILPEGSWNAFMLNRVPGPGVHAVRPDMSMSQRLDGSCALPPSRQLMPMIAIGSRGPFPTFSNKSCSLNTDHGEWENPSLWGVRGVSGDSTSTLPL